MSEKQVEEAQDVEKPEQVEEEFELTPEIMEYENRRTDLIISIAVLALIFFLAAIRDRSADLWLRFRLGESVAKSFPSVPKTDSLTYTAEGKPWINPSWLYDWATYLIAKPGFDETGAAVANGAALVGAKVAVCVLAIWLILLIRHPGPTRWWAAVCGALAAIGFSGRLALGPEIVGNCLLIVVAFLWFQARFRGRFGLIYLAPIAAVFWANIDFTWVLAPLLLLLAGIGELIQAALPLSGQFARSRLSGGKLVQVFIVAAVCGLAGLATPYGIDGLLFPYRWFSEILPNIPGLERETLGWTPFDAMIHARRLFSSDLPWAYHAWFGLITLSVVGFLVNVNSLSVGRLLWSLVGAALPFVALRYLPASCLLLAVPASLNFQEFFIEGWGTEARITRGWVLWSQIGRALSILLVFGAIFCAFTGRVQKIAGAFGFGIRMENYMVDASRYLQKIKPQGNCLAFTVSLANFQTWAQPGAKDFVDTRFQMGKDVLAEYSGVRNALFGDFYPRPQKPAIPSKPANNPADNKSPTNAAKTAPTTSPATIPQAADAIPADAPAVPAPDAVRGPPTAEELAKQEKAWKEIFDKYKITHVAIDPRIDPVHSRLQAVLNNFLNSPNFVPVFMSDQAVIFGRVDGGAANVDQKLFQEKAIKTNKLVFRENRKPPKPTERPVTPPGWIDWIWRTRAVSTPGVTTGETYRRASRNIDQPGGVYLGIESIRDALAENPDSGEGYFALELCYNTLFRFEAFSALLAARVEEAKAKKAAQEAAGTANSTKAGSGPVVSAPIDKPAAPEKSSTVAAAPAKSNPVTTPAPKVPGVESPSDSSSQDQGLRLPSTNGFISMRHYQIMAAARSAAIAQPNNALAQLELYKLCFSNRFFDSALFHLREARKLLPKDEIQDQLQRVDIALETEVKARMENYNKFVEQQRTEYEKRGMDPDRPYERASYAINLQLTQLAMEQIEAASAFSPDLAEAGPFVVGLYLTMGYPDRALPPLQQMRQQQRRFAPGEWSWLMGQIQLMSGQYEEADKSVETALAELRASRAASMIEGFDRRVRDGELLGLFTEATALGNDQDREARYLFTRGLIRIEMGRPDTALKDFKKCLEVSPRYGFRSVIAAYWPYLTDEKLKDAPPQDYEKAEIKVKLQPRPTTNSASSSRKETKPAATSDVKSAASPKPVGGNAPAAKKSP